MSHTDGGTPDPEGDDPVVIDASSPVTRWKWRCPNGHTSIEPTNGGIWCKACANAVDIDDPHHHELHNVQTGETVSWSRIRFSR